MLFLTKHERDTKLYYAVIFLASSIFFLSSKTFEISDYCYMFLRVIPKGSYHFDGEMLKHEVSLEL